MSVQRTNRISGRAMIGLSLAALATVLVGLTQPPQPEPHDEGALARIFQLTIVALLPTSLIFVATADWRRAWRTARPLALAMVVTALAFGILYYFENLR
jgi:hypothetical protein